MRAKRFVPFFVLALAAAVVFLWPTSHPDESLTQPEPTTTTAPFIPGVYGTSWEVMRGAPVAGRERMALAEVDGDVFVFGGTVGGFSEPDLPPDMFLQDAWIFDTDQRFWKLAIPAPFAMCQLADPVAVSGGGAAPVVLWGRVDPAEADCARAAAYDPEVGWTALDDTFFDRLEPGEAVFWQDGADVPVEDWPPLTTPGWGRLVAPASGLSYTLPGGEVSTLAAGSAGVVSIGVRSGSSSTWTGEWFLSVDAGLLVGWEAAADQWRWNLGGTPIGSDGQDIAGSADGAFLVNRLHEAAYLSDPTAPWSVLDSVPLRAGGCRVEITLVGDRPVVRSCAGIAVYDDLAGGWVPFPPPIGIEGSLIATDESLFWFSSQVSRLDFLPGGVIAARRLPIGLTEIALPEGYQFISAIGLVQTTDAEMRVISEVHGFEVITPNGDICSVLGSYRPTPDTTEPLGTISVGRPILPPLEVLEYSTGAGARLVVQTSPTDTIEIRCALRTDALELVAALQWIKV